MTTSPEKWETLKGRYFYQKLLNGKVLFALRVKLVKSLHLFYISTFRENDEYILFFAYIRELGGVFVMGIVGALYTPHSPYNRNLSQALLNLRLNMIP